MLSIGDIESALPYNKSSQAEVDRLPLLLRLLTTAQPLASVPSLIDSTTKSNSGSDPFVDAVVSRLEHVAATHSAAEAIDMLTGHICSTISRRISKLPPLKKRNGKWDTHDLAVVAVAPLGIRKNRSGDAIAGESDDGLDSADEDKLEKIDSIRDKRERDGEEESAAPPYKKKKKGELIRNGSVEGRDSLLLGSFAEDSQEAYVTRVWSEVALLVVESLQKQPKSSVNQKSHPDVEHPDEASPSSTELSVKVDSLLSESDTATTMPDLGACLSAIVHHAPVLRHAHMAQAFLRASVPQAVGLIYRMGENSPTAVPCLVRGCLEAANCSSSQTILKKAKESIRKLATLSPRESSRIRGVLSLSNQMVDVQLELAVEADPIALACLITRYSSAGMIRESLKGKPSLVSKILQCLVSIIKNYRSSAFGKLKLFARALLWLVLSTNSEDIQYVDKATIVEVATTLGKIFNWLGDMSSPKDEMFGIILCTSLVVCLLLAVGNSTTTHDHLSESVPTLAATEDGQKSWQGLLKILLASTAPSVCADALLSRFAMLLHAQNISELELLVKDCIKITGMENQHVFECFHQNSFCDGFTKLCKWAVVNGDLELLYQKTLHHSMVALDPSTLIQMIRADNIEKENLEKLMKDVLSNGDSASKLLHHRKSYELLSEAITFLSKENEHAIPLVSQVYVHTVIHQSISKCDKVERDEVLKNRMILNFAYSVLFLEENPDSPFAFDLREEPMFELVQLLEEESGCAGSICENILSILRRRCPDIISANALYPATEVFSQTDLQHKHHVLKLLTSTLRNSMKNLHIDPSGMAAERAYLLAQRGLPSTEVDCVVIRTMIALPNTPAPFLTYGMLCRDPLLILQFPLTVWQCRGFRRVILSILGRLLNANDTLVRQASPSEDVTDEFLTSRNLILLRSLLGLATGHAMNENKDPFHKPNQSIVQNSKNHRIIVKDYVLTEMIRSTISKQEGLIATLFRHGVPDEVVDWLVDTVPECIRDANALRGLLSERTPMAAAERLRTADASLRVAIATNNEVEAKNLANSCLNQLVSSFYLVLGPVGVPVNALIEESGMDLTQVCRKATFRILHALQHVSCSRTGLKSECSSALQKLAGMCKAESNSGSPRRKALLKEIWDAIVKALNAMGSGVSLN